MKKIKIFLFALCAALVLSGCEDDEITVINIYHTSGIGGMYWSRTEPAFANREVGGLAVLKSFYEKEPGKKILIDGGDWFSRTQEGTLGGISKALELMSRAGYSASGMSYADLGAGWAAASQELKAAKFPILAADLANSAGKIPAPLKAGIIRDVSGVKLGIFSLVIKNTSAGPHTRLTEIKITDEFTAARAQVEKLKENGADIIILMVDIAENADNYDEHNIIEEVEGIDIILGSAISGESGAMEKIADTYVVRTEPYLTSVSRLRINISEDKKITNLKYDSLPLYKDRYGADEDIKKEVTALREKTHRTLNRVVAHSKEDFADIDDAPSALGEIVANCIRNFGKSEFAIINSDSLRSDIKKGPITEYQLYELYPYNDTIMSVRIRGDQIKNLVEKSLLSGNNFPQVSGLYLTYDMDAPAGQKVKSIKVGSNDLRKNTIYRMYTTDHIIAGGFGHDDFINVVEFKNTNVDVRTVLRSCFSRRKTIETLKGQNWTPVKK